MLKSLIPTSLSIYRNLSKIQKNIYVIVLHIFCFSFFCFKMLFSFVFWFFFQFFFQFYFQNSNFTFSVLFSIIFSFKCIYKTVTPKCTFSKLLSQKIHFLKIALSENTFSKFLSEIMKNNFPKCIFKIVCLKNIFSKLLPHKFHFWNFPSKKQNKKKTKMKLLSQKRHFQNCSLKKFFLKITFWMKAFSKNINQIALIYSSSDSSESSKSLSFLSHH